MAVDSRIKRASALDFGWPAITQGDSGTVDQAARADLMGLYAGLTYSGGGDILARRRSGGLVRALRLSSLILFWIGA